MGDSKHVRLLGGGGLEVVAGASRGFRERFGRAPEWRVAAPGRVNLIGEHVDYNDGFVLPMAIDRWTAIAASPNQSRLIRFVSTASHDEAVIDLARPITCGEPGWANYLRGVVEGVRRVGGGEVVGFDAFVDSTIPLGGGLSSSAALEVACATLLELVIGRELGPEEKALLCQRAEHEFAGVPCGIMDQFISVMAREGSLLLLDCRSRWTEVVPMQDATISVLVVNSNVRHTHSGGEYAKRRRDCELAASALGVVSLRDVSLDQLNRSEGLMEPVVFRRARHVVTEIERTLSAVSAAKQGDWVDFGVQMRGSHDSLRDDFEVSCPEVDLLVDMTNEIGLGDGVYGSRMTGGGFGGCTVSLVSTAAVDSICARLEERYRVATGITPSMFVSRPMGGACVCDGE